MNKAIIIEKYFYNLEIRSYDELISLFKADAVIYSPLYGQILASKFYIDLFKDTKNKKITIISPENSQIFLNEYIEILRTIKNE